MDQMGAKSHPKNQDEKKKIILHYIKAEQLEPIIEFAYEINLCTN